MDSKNLVFKFMFSDLYNGAYNYMNYTPNGTATEVDLHTISLLEGLSDSQKDELLMMQPEGEDALYSRIYIRIDGPNIG